MKTVLPFVEATEGLQAQELPVIQTQRLQL